MIDKINITVHHSIIINKSCEEVFDFTQDFSKRMLWEKSIVECKLISEVPVRIVSIKIRGGMTATLEYKLFERPHKTSLRMTSITPPLVIDGGGSWIYEEQNNGATLWTQTNTISLKNNFPEKLLKMFVKKNLKQNTIASMLNAKQILEK